ncbi:hypothetical protein ACFO4O_13330 [Glaciecola siphonariae]|uniref:DUF4785 domain-containing protein n=1 Tax=Glaciecola siphonariae TaxID=521012 RepID=A0ABV9LZ83_9ALTE
MSKPLILILSAIVICAWVIWFAWPDAGGASDAHKNTNNEQTTPLNAPLPTPAPNKPSPELTTQLIAQVDEPALATLATQISDIADAFSQQSQFPLESQPVLHPEQVVVYEPFAETWTEFSLPSQAYGEIKLALATDEYQYFTGQDVEVLVQIAGVPSDADVDVSVEMVESDSANAAAIETIDVESNFSGQWEANETIPASTFEYGSLPEELQLNAYVTVDNEVFFSSSVFKYTQPSATVTGLDNPNPNNEYLDIPLNVDVHKSGYFYVSAVLYDQNNDTPLIQLQQEARLSSGSQEIVLKAHIQALKFKGNEGPYRLSNIRLKRGAEEGEQFDQAGNSEAKSYEVEGFGFDRYEDKTFFDPLAAERESFLRQLGSISGAN